jgi:hypothetical protein
MKKYIITSPSYTGEINVLYGLDWKLLYIDFLKCDLSDEQMQYFKDRVPVNLTPDPSPQGEGNVGLEKTEILASKFGKSKLNIIEEGYFVSFDQWWTRYNLKRNKDRCEKLWQKLSDADKVNAYFKLGMYDRHLALNTWKTKAEPDTYLRGKYWNNDWSK